MDAAALLRRTVATFNRHAMQPLLHTGPGGRLLGRWFAELSYTGRRSGRRITVPVNYRRDKATGDLLVLVAVPSAKTWWRNFTGSGGAVRVRTGGQEKDGFARVERGPTGSVTVRIAF
ncbi:PNPOx family protein [Jatrophihabitans fulvus]